MGFTELLTLVLVILKGTGHLSWSWWQVFIPEYIAGGFWLLAALGVTFGVLHLRRR
jgi:hypothetical protein